VARPKRFYVYAIHVDGVLRYIGKGCNGRMYAHMKEVRQRLTREFNLKTSPVAAFLKISLLYSSTPASPSILNSR
jgi:hypothetical protein